jgi:hypothetical protein
MSELGQGNLWQLLGGFPNLQRLSLTDNYIATALDLSALAASCPLLTELELDGNAWTGDLSGVHELASLEYLNVERNLDTLTGSIPTEIALLTSLTELRVGGNALTGTVPWSHLFDATMNLRVLYVPTPLSAFTLAPRRLHYYRAASSLPSFRSARRRRLGREAHLHLLFVAFWPSRDGRTQRQARARHTCSTLGCVEVNGVDFCNSMEGELVTNDQLQEAIDTLEYLCVALPRLVCRRTLTATCGFRIQSPRLYARSRACTVSGVKYTRCGTRIRVERPARRIPCAGRRYRSGRAERTSRSWRGWRWQGGARNGAVGAVPLGPVQRRLCVSVPSPSNYAWVTAFFPFIPSA